MKAGHLFFWGGLTILGLGVYCLVAMQLHWNLLFGVPFVILGGVWVRSGRKRLKKAKNAEVQE